MTRVSALLLVAVMLSALYLVRTQYESRRLYTELDRAKAQAQRLETEYDRLDVERGAQATPLRVEKLAREQLHMHTISPAITQYASPQRGVVESAVAPDEKVQP
jgi:cell division protein FtsL